MSSPISKDIIPKVEDDSVSSSESHSSIAFYVCLIVLGVSVGCPRHDVISFPVLAEIYTLHPTCMFDVFVRATVTGTIANKMTLQSTASPWVRG